MKDILKMLGISEKVLSNDECSASEEVHMICDWLMRDIAATQEQFQNAVLNSDFAKAHEIQIVCDTLYVVAEAIHAGEHLEGE